MKILKIILKVFCYAFLLIIFIIATISCNRKNISENKNTSLIKLKNNEATAFPFGIVRVKPHFINNEQDKIIFDGFENTSELLTNSDILLFALNEEVNDCLINQRVLVNKYSKLNLPETKENIPGFSNYKLCNGKIETSITATERCAFYKFIFVKEDNISLIIKLIADSSTENYETEFVNRNFSFISGYIFNKADYQKNLYFAIQFSRAFQSFKVVDKEKLKFITKKSANNFIGIASFSTKYDNQLKVKLSVSPVSLVGAEENLRKELTGWTFDNYVNSATEQWNTYFSRINVETQNINKAEEFYVSLYNELLKTAIVSDYYSQYVTVNGKIETANGTRVYKSENDVNSLVYNLVGAVEIDDIKKTAELFKTINEAKHFNSKTLTMIGIDASSSENDIKFSPYIDFKKVVIKSQTGKTFEIIANEKLASENFDIFVNEIKINYNSLNISDIQNGGTLVFKSK